jgi:hypothetical protein
MRTTTRRIVTLATCGAAFALPVIAGGTAQAAEKSGARVLSRGGVTVIIGGSDNGTAATLAKGGSSASATTGHGYGAVSGQAKTILIAKLSPAKPYNSSYSYSDRWYASTESHAGTNATGTVVALTKVGTTTIVSKYQAVANCEKSEYTTTYKWWGDTYNNVYDGCQLSSTSGTYKAKGGAVAAGLPQTGSTELYSYSNSGTGSYNGVQQGSWSNNESCQSFNSSDCNDDHE